MQAIAPAWTSVAIVGETSSTNADLVAAAHDGAPHGSVFVAEQQSAGHGRMGRSWTSPPRSSLLFSVLLRPRVPLARWSWLPLLTGLAVLPAIRGVGVEPALKWPNDVLIGERKLAGILAERAGDAVVVGVGLNVTLSEAELPVPTATSLALEGAPDVDRADLLAALLHAFGERYDAWEERAGDPAHLLEAYRRSCDTLGRSVRVQLPHAPDLIGTAVDVDGDGRLVVQPDEAGAGPVTLASGDVVHVRRR